MRFPKKLALMAAGLIVAAVLIYRFTPRPDESRAGQPVPILAAGHISADAPTPVYNSNPPTSGPHSGAVRGGFYPFEINDINAVHNLEHGFIWITYKDADNETLASLLRIGQQYPGTVMVSARAANDAPISVVSWGRIEKMTAFDEAFILDFISRNRNQSPERFAK